MHSSLRGLASRDPRASNLAPSELHEALTRRVWGEIVRLVGSEVWKTKKKIEDWERLGAKSERQIERYMYLKPVDIRTLRSLVVHTYAVVLRYPAKGFP